MKNRRIRFSQLGISLGSAFFLSSPALAEETEIAWTDWTQMRPSSFPGTIDSAVAQCERSARYSKDDPLTDAMCVTYREMLEANHCEVVSVPDGIGYRFMNGLSRNQRQALSHYVVKKLGRDDPAVRCQLSDTVTADWFTGVLNQSCNNVGFTFLKNKEEEAEWVCKNTEGNVLNRPVSILFAPGHVYGACSCGHYHAIPAALLVDQGTQLQSNGGFYCQSETKE